MKKLKLFKTLFLFLILAGLLTACAYDSKNSHAYLPDAKTENALVYIEQCGACHAVPHPQRLSAAAWKDLVVVMDARREERDHEPLTEAQRNKLMAYLAEHAR